VVLDALRSTDDDVAVFVAVTRTDDVAAFMHLRSAVDYFTERKQGHVADIVVAEQYEGRGLARTLLAAADEWARGKGYEWMSIGVFEGNTRAAALYERLGYKRDIVKMLKSLK
jgi:ribosomal protein S18 acetylase RimI-like enzyme